jgi:hypothetical protein
MNYSNKYPMWHNRFIDAQNHLSEAVMLMKQAHFEDKNNPKFHALYKRMGAVSTAVNNQALRNFKRGRKEGWLK